MGRRFPVVALRTVTSIGYPCDGRFVPPRPNPFRMRVVVSVRELPTLRYS
jgi:hypothetical protein